MKRDYLPAVLLVLTLVVLAAIAAGTTGLLELRPTTDGTEQWAREFETVALESTSAG